MSPGPGRHVLVYDGECGLCRRSVAWVLARDERGLLEALPYQDPSVPLRFPELDLARCRRAIQLIGPKGQRWEAARASEVVLSLLPRIGWASLLFRIPGVRPAAALVYRVVSRHRRQIGCGDHCGVPGAAPEESTLFAIARFVVGSAALLKGVSLTLSGLDPPLLATWFLLSSLIFAGAWGRQAAVALALLIVPLLFAGFYKNHLYLMTWALALLALTDCERSYSLRPRASDASRPWVPFLMMCQLSIVYAFAALAKINGEWMSGDVLAYRLARSIFPIPDLPSEVLVSVATAVIAVQLGLAALAWSSRWRWAFIGVAIPFHTGMLAVADSAVELLNLFVFTLLMLALFLAFFVREEAMTRTPAATERRSSAALT